MQNLLLSLAVLACAIEMGLMMWMMARGRRSGGADSPADANAHREMTRLHAKVGQLTARRISQHG